MSNSNFEITQGLGTKIATDLNASGEHEQKIQVTNLPGSQAVTGAFFQTTQPVSVASLPLPTGAAKDAIADLSVTATGAAAAAVTLTLPAVTSQSHYISLIELTLYSAAARTGVAAPVTVTSTNLPGSPAWTFATAAALGSTDVKVFSPSVPLKSSASGVATTIVCPAVTGGIWRVNVHYFTR